jgi:hypothetical protein
MKAGVPSPLNFDVVKFPCLVFDTHIKPYLFVVRIILVV